MIAIIDYGMGNLASVKKACAFVGHEAVITDNRHVIENASHVILPGVGAAHDAVSALREKGLFDFAVAQAKSGKPFLGICLGMQLLFEYSMENGRTDCLGLIPGHIAPFETELRVPHMGWNNISTHDETLFAKENPFVYFVHSYHAADVPQGNVIAECEYDYRFCAAARSGNVYGTQFHPEKSGAPGLRMIERFGKLK